MNIKFNLNDDKFTKKINSTVFPGIQGGPLEHIIAGKGICFEEASTPEFKLYAKQVINNAKTFAEEFINHDWKVISNGTDNHMFVLNVYDSIGFTGKEVEQLLDEIKITVNKNQIPNDELPPLKSSGIRLGTPAMTTKGFKEQDFVELANIIINYLTDIKNNNENEEKVSEIKSKYNELVRELVMKYV